jgi:hypothetical protein
MSTLSEDIGPSQRMENMLSGHYAAQCLHVIAVLRIPDLLASGHATVESLASAAHCDPPSLRRLLRMLVRLGLFAENTEGQFQLTPLGALLRSDIAGSMHDRALFTMSAPVWSACGAMLDSVRTGEPSFVKIHNATVYAYFRDHSDLGAVFNRYMMASSYEDNTAIVQAYDFSEVRLLVDVGGGMGATLVALLRQYPAMLGILFDLPEVVEAARLEAPDIIDRFRAAGGNMLQSIPAGGDVYMIKRVLMDKSDYDAEKILRNCLAVMRGTGKILVIDPMLPASTEPHPNWLTDMRMLVQTGGRCRTESDFRDLFNRAGLTLSRVICTRSPNFILEAVRQ